MSSLYAIWTVNVAINIATLFAHVTGMYAIMIHRQATNQTLILFNLSVTEFLQSLRSIVNNIARLIMYHNGYKDTMFDMLMNIHPRVYEELNCFFYLAPSIQLVLLMMVLTVDRLICSINPLKYLIRFRINIVKRLVISCWIFSIVLGIVYAIFPKFKTLLIMIFTVIGWFYFIFAIVSYIIIVRKIRSPNRKCREPSHQHKLQRQRFRKCYTVPGLIILSFFFLYGIPFLTIKFGIDRSHIGMDALILNAGLAIAMDVGLMSDAFIYIVLTPHFRKTITLKCFRCNKEEKEDKDTASQSDKSNQLHPSSIIRRETIEGFISHIHDESTL